MKAEEYIQDHTRRCSNELVSVESIDGKEVRSYYPWMTVEGALEAVGIAREELSHSEVTKTCPRYDQEAVSEDFEEEVDAFWHDGISQEQDEVEGVLNKTEFKAYARHFAQWQKEQDRKKFELLKEWFQDIAEKCERITSGNVSHNGAAIRGFAKNCVEYIESSVL